jgi:hypothetical protein
VTEQPQERKLRDVGERELHKSNPIFFFFFSYILRYSTIVYCTVVVLYFPFSNPKLDVFDSPPPSNGDGSFHSTTGRISMQEWGSSPSSSLSGGRLHARRFSHGCCSRHGPCGTALAAMARWTLFSYRPLSTNLLNLVGLVL